MGRIVIAGLRELGVHGVLPEEQARPQPFEVDVELVVDLEAAGSSDALDDTVDYSAVSESISRVVRTEQYQLLERLEFTRGKKNWGYAFRFGLVEISQADFDTVAQAMKAEV